MGEIIIMGEFNVKPGCSLLNEWQQVCDNNALTFSDVSLLNKQNVTHVNHASTIFLWMDHCLSSQTVHGSLAEISVDNIFFSSDHCPLRLQLNCLNMPSFVEISSPHTGYIGTGTVRPVNTFSSKS